MKPAASPGAGELEWATPHAIALELPTMRLRDFSTAPPGPSAGRAALICGPFALHGANVADFAPGHSVVETLRQAGLGRVHVTDWRSATARMRDFGIDNYLADLNVAVDEIGPADLIGICQGGWLALLYAARFPGKVGRLVIAGAPVDIEAGQSELSQLANSYPIEVYENLVRLGDGVVQGQRTLQMWTSASLAATRADDILQLPLTTGAAERAALASRFEAWNAATVDLPGAYYLEVVNQLYRQNRIVRGEFVALGHRIDLAALRTPLYLLVGHDDKVVAPQQLLAIASQVGTPRESIRTVEAPCGHLSLFMGHETLTGIWTDIARWLMEHPVLPAAGPLAVGIAET
ncbi:MAG: alpha/beta hydrolase [Xanthobacteraceae bacterium]|nr:MAG: alpha/beta hydrolase [Xanthobacteraceae bacterium]